MNGERTTVMPSGSINKARVGGIEQLEQDISWGLASKLGGEFHYDELDGMKAVRNDAGKVDIVLTFMQARTLKTPKNGGQ